MEILDVAPSGSTAVVMPPDGHMTPDTTPAWRSAWFRVTIRRLGTALQQVTPDRQDVALSTRAVLLVLALLAGG